MYQNKHISIIIPAYNEAASIAQVVTSLQQLGNHATENISPWIDDIIVCNNASTDNTGYIAKTAGARVIDEKTAGYGAACLAAVTQLKSYTDIIVFVDGDASVKTDEITILLDAIISGVDLAIGARVAHQQEKQALFPQQQWGNRVVTYIIQALWSQPISDLGPFRAIRAQCLHALDMSDVRFGWTVEMQIKAFQSQLLVAEYSVSTRKRVGKSKVSGTWKGTLLAGYDMLSTIAVLYFKGVINKRKSKLKSLCNKRSTKSDHNKCETHSKSPL